MLSISLAHEQMRAWAAHIKEVLDPECQAMEGASRASLNVWTVWNVSIALICLRPGGHHLLLRPEPTCHNSKVPASKHDGSTMQAIVCSRDAERFWTSINAQALQEGPLPGSDGHRAKVWCKQRASEPACYPFCAHQCLPVLISARQYHS